MRTLKVHFSAEFQQFRFQQSAVQCALQDDVFSFAQFLEANVQYFEGSTDATSMQMFWPISRNPEKEMD